MSATEVELEVRNSQQKIPVSEIRHITFSQEPTQLRRARDQIREGQLQDALFALNQIDPTKYRDYVKADVEFYSAYCRVRIAIETGKVSTSIAKVMYQFYQENKDSYHYFAAVEALGDLAMALGKYSGAAYYYGLMTSAPLPEIQVRGALLEGAALRSDGKIAEAQKKYESVIANAGGASRAKALAQIGRAACLAETGQASDAVELVNQIIAENDPKDTELFALAYNALGAGYRGLNQPMDAVMAYLHVDLLFHQKPEAHAEALYYLSQLWNQVKNKKPERATAARSLLKSRYPSSRWAQM